MLWVIVVKGGCWTQCKDACTAVRHELRMSLGWLAGLSHVPRSKLGNSFHFIPFCLFIIRLFFSPQLTFVVKPAPLGVALIASEIVCLDCNARSFPLKGYPNLWVAHDQPQISQAAKKVTKHYKRYIWLIFRRQVFWGHMMQFWVVSFFEDWQLWSPSMACRGYKLHYNAKSIGTPLQISKCRCSNHFHCYSCIK